MKNREEIQKIVQYNNEVKYKDAGVNRHVKGLDSILGEGLLKLAVAAGPVAIEEVVKDYKAKQAKKKDEEKKQTRAHAENYEADASKTQRRITKEGFFNEYADATAKGKKVLRDYYNKQGKHQLGDIGVAYHNKMSGMETIEKLDAEFSEKNKIIVDAKVRGNIEANDLDTHSNSSIDGNIKCKNVSIGGKLKGNIKSDRINIKKTAEIEGSFNQKTLSIEEIGRAHV